MSEYKKGRDVHIGTGKDTKYGISLMLYTEDMKALRKERLMNGKEVIFVELQELKPETQARTGHKYRVFQYQKGDE